MKRWRAGLLSALLAANLLLPALAAEVPTVGISTEKTEYMSGEEIEITLTLDRDAENVGALEYRLHYDTETLEYLDGSAVSSNPGLHVIRPVKGRMHTGALFSYDYTLPEGSAQEAEATRIPAGELVKLRFRATNVSRPTPAELRLENKAANSIDFKPISLEASAPLTVTVMPRSGYSAGIRIRETAAVDEKLTAYIDVSANGYDNFNASQILIRYDNTRLRYEGCGSNIYSCEAVEDGVLRLADFGDTEELRDGAYALDFTAIASGEAELRLTVGECGFSPLESAAGEDLLQATLIRDAAKVTISEAQHKVTLPKGWSGNAWVSHGEDYTFTPGDDADCYDYGPVTAQVNGESISLKENGDGSYTVENVTGELVVSGTRSPKAFAVHVSGSGEKETVAEESAVYLSDYSFTVNKQGGYGYTVSVTIGGKTYTGITNDGNLYTIPGRDIRGDISISVEKKSTGGGDEDETYRVTVTGNAKEDVEAKAEAKSGKNYSFTLSKQENYSYTINITIDGAPYTGYSYSGTTYTIPGKDVKGNIAIRAEKTKLDDDEPHEQYKVTVNGNASGSISANTGENAAANGTDYSFTLKKTTGYTYTIAVTVGGKTYSNYRLSGSTYTIPGADVTGNIVITATRKTTGGGTTGGTTGGGTGGGTTGGGGTATVAVEGNAAGAVTAAATTALRKDFGFTVKMEEGYDYTVTATVNGTETEVIDRGNGSYRISAENVTGNIRLRVEKTPRGEALTITHYLSLNDTELYLLRYSPNREKDSVPCLDGVRMYRSPAYGSFALLFTAREEPVREELMNRITFEKADAKTLDYSGDLNLSGNPDVADAEMILDMYNLVCASPSALENGMELYLRADLNHDGVLNCTDAAAAMKLTDQ